MSRAKDGAAKGQGTPFLEWVVAAIGAAILAGMVGYLAWMGLTGEEGPPQLSVRVEAVEEAGGGWLVRFVAANEGPSAAAAVQVIGTLGQGEAAEESETVLDYVPQRSERRGGLMFGREPAAGELELRVGGFSQP